MIKELNEASKKTYEICKKAEDEMWSFERLMEELQQKVKVHGVPFPTLMFIEIVDQFIQDRPLRQKKEEEFDDRDVQEGFDRVSKDILAAPLATCQETGWMVVNNDHKVVIMRSWCVDRDDNHGGGAIAIPKGWVTKIEYLQGTHAHVRD